MITMYDSTNPLDIPAEAEAVGGYVNGFYTWRVDAWSRFTAALVVRRISVNASRNEGDTLDVENGAATPFDCARWVAMRRQAGVADPWIYCAKYVWPDIMTLMAQEGQEAQYWIADPAPLGVAPGLPHSIEGAIACQYAWEPESGGHYDLSLVNVSPILVATHEEAEMLSATDPKSGNIILADAAGEVFVFDRHGAPAAVGYLGGLNGHPEFHAGGGADNGPVVGIGISDDGNPALSAYVLITRDATDNFHPYLFPSSGALVIR